MPKKVFLVLVTMFLVIAMIGCEKKERNESYKTFSCSLKTSIDNDNYVQLENFTFYYDEDRKNLKKYTQLLSFDYHSSESVATYAERDYNTAIQVCDEVTEFKGVNCNVHKNKETNNLTFNLEIIVSEVDEKSKMGESIKSLKRASYNELKESFLNSDVPWSCEER